MGATETTSLNLLTREGIVTCCFESKLSPEQYDSLFKFVRQAETREQLKGYLARFADKWNIGLVME